MSPPAHLELYQDCDFILANLDFELTWAHQHHSYTLPKLIRQLAHHWRAILRLLAPNATVLDPHLLYQFTASGQLPSLPPGRLLPWGHTPQLLDFAHQSNLQLPHPPLPLISKINRKTYATSLNQDLQLPGIPSVLITTLDDLTTAIHNLNQPWILKTPWGVAGRGQRRGQAQKLTVHDRAWASKALATEHALILEPLVDILQEYSFHFHLPPPTNAHLPASSVLYLGHCHLHAHPNGTLRGLASGPGLPAPPQPLLDAARTVAHHIAHTGYFGPLSLDSFTATRPTHTSPDSPDSTPQPLLLRPLSEINARITFGRLAIALADHLNLPPSDFLRWHHVPHRTPGHAPHLSLTLTSPSPPPPPGAYLLPPNLGHAPIEIIRTSPDWPAKYQYS